MMHASLKSQPLLKTVPMFFFGIVIGWKLFSFLPLWFTTFILLFNLLLVITNLRKNSLLNQVLVYLLVFFAGCDFAAARKLSYSRNNLITTLTPGTKVSFSARLSDDDWEKTTKLRKVEVLICRAGDNWYENSGKFWLRSNSGQHFNRNDLIFGQAVFKPISPKRNPADFDFAAFSLLYNLQGILETSDSLAISKSSESLPQKAIGHARNDIIGKIDKYFSGTDSEILKALTIGLRAELPEEVSQNLRYSGLWHLVSLSGLHLGIIAGLFALVFSFIGLSASKRNVLIIICIWLFVLIADAGAPLIRSAIVITLFIGSRYLGRWVDIWNLLAFSALIIVLYEPAELFSPGFQLTYAAVGFIIAGSRFWRSEEGKFAKKIRRWYLGKVLIDGLSAAFFAALGTAPLLAYHFGGIPLSTIPSSIIAVPLVDLTLSVFPLFYIFSFFSEQLTVILSNFLWGCLKVFEWIVEIFSTGWQYLSTPDFDLFTFIAVYCTIVLMLMRKRIWLPAALILLNLLVWRQAFREPPAEITFFDVGQGVCAVATIPPDMTIMVDTGPASRKFNPMEKSVIPYLRQQGISDIDYLILSHNDTDHTGGAEYLLENFQVRQVILGGGFSEFSFPAPVKSNRAGDWLKAGEALLLFFNPFGQSEDNEASLVLKLIYGESEIIFPGDINIKTEKQLLHYQELLDADILLTAHHGSKYSSDSNFLKLVTPEWAVISCGRNNRYGHPHPETLARLQQVKTSVLRTDETGAITFKLTKSGVNY